MAGVVGASVWPQTYTGATSRIDASTTFDGFVGRAYAHSVQRQYYTQDKNGNCVFPTATSIDSPGDAGDLGKHGIRTVISFKCAQDATGAYTGSRFITEKRNLIAALNVIKADTHVICDDIALWHEPNNGDFASSTLYHQYVAFYQSAVRNAGFQLHYIPALSSANTSLTYYPGDANCDVVSADYYAHDYVAPAKRTTLADLEAIADAGGKGFGITEMGLASGTQSAPPTTAQFIDWAENQVLAVFAARAAAGKPNAYYIWYSLNSTGPNHIDGTTDPLLIAEMQRMYDVLNGLGGGGGSSAPAARAPAWPGNPEPGSFSPGDVSSAAGAAPSVTVSATLQAIFTPSGKVTGGTGTVTTPGPVPAPLTGLPQIIAEIGVSPAVPVAPTGTLLLSDPVYGQLNLNTLGAVTIWTDISGYVRSGSVTRTSTRQNAPVITYDAGTLTATLKNSDGRFDPDNLSGPYVANGVTQLRPMTPVRVQAAWAGVIYSMFSGFADSWATPDTNFGPHYTETTVSATDAFKVFAGYQLGAQAAAFNTQLPLGSGEDAGARVARILNLAGWDTSARNLDTGNSSLLGTTLQGPDALTEMQLAVDTELGELYVGRAGNVVFRRRHGVMEDTRSTDVQAVFGDQPGSGQVLNSNPGFETGDTSGWTTANGATANASSLSAYTGSFGATFVPDGITAGGALITNPRSAVAPGQYVTFSAWIRGNRSWPMQLIIRFFDGSGTQLAGTDLVTTIQTTTAFAQASVTGFAPAGAVTCTGRVVFQGTPPATSYSQSVDEAYLLISPELPYAGLGRSNDDVMLCNDAQITASGSSNLQEATDAASIATFLYPRSYSRTDVLLESDAEALEYAQFLVYISKGAEDRFDTITLNPLRDPARLFPQALGRELGDRIAVIRRPPGMSPIIKELFIRGVSHTVDVSSMTWQTQWQLQDASRYGFLTLGDPASGELNQNALAH